MMKMVLKVVFNMWQNARMNLKSNFVFATNRPVNWRWAPSLIVVASVATAVFGAAACGDDDADPAPGKPDISAQVGPVLENYAANLETAYGDTVDDGKALGAAVDTLVATPTEANLEAARTAWVASRAHYMLVEGARFYDGPIDVEPPGHEGALNSWPLDEAYIDYTTNKATGEVDESQGFINKPDLLPTASITAEKLDELNTQGGDTNISNGYHAIEFLLWGQAIADVGPGTRPASDFDPAGPRKNADRRGRYLKVATESVVAHLTDIHGQWAPTAPYRTAFVGGGLASIAKALSGLGKLSKGEMAGERISAAYESKERRDQHDCFSSVTLLDYQRDLEGIQAMYLGDYGGKDGPGIDTLVAAVDPELDGRLKTQLQQSVDLIKAVPGPFEAAIVGADDAPGRQALAAVIASLRAQGDLFAEAATALGLSIEVKDSND
jgi:putative iron-regulated protein